MAGISEAILVEILRRGVSNGASDIHFKVGEPPLYRVNGSLHVESGAPSLTADDTRQIGTTLLARSGYNFKIEQVREFDFAYSASKIGRFRVNLFRARGTFAVVCRLIPVKVPVLTEMNLPEVLQKLSLVHRGLIVVTGSTGSGKSTTLAAMIDHINRNRRTHILTIEDPIEYLHRNRKAAVSQREVGTDTQSFMSAFRGALRQDPDVILVGELRDNETMDMALKAAETGHVVMSTLHTMDTPKTINRIMSFFEPALQGEVRLRLADCLEAIVCQRLVKRTDKPGRIAVCEILVATPAIRDCIRDPAKTINISQLQEEGESYGMRTFDQHVVELYTRGVIDRETARSAATSPSNFDRHAAIMDAEAGLAREKSAKKRRAPARKGPGGEPSVERFGRFGKDDG
jgi:twitching motility protein PilT